jgi:hypothetical protein
LLFSGKDVPNVIENIEKQHTRNNDGGKFEEEYVVSLRLKLRIMCIMFQNSHYQYHRFLQTTVLLGNVLNSYENHTPK